MAGKVLKNFTNGWAGQISRSIDDVVEAFPNGEATAHIAFGAPVALDSNGKVKNISATNADDLIGVAVRTIKTENTYAGNDPDYLPKEMVDVLKRGTIAVHVTSGTPAPKGKVYIVKATGAFVTAADSTNTLETNWKFKGTKDANDIAEIVIPERVY